MFGNGTKMALKRKQEAEVYKAGNKTGRRGTRETLDQARTIKEDFKTSYTTGTLQTNRETTARDITCKNRSNSTISASRDLTNSPFRIVKREFLYRCLHCLGQSEVQDTLMR